MSVLDPLAYPAARVDRSPSSSFVQQQPTLNSAPPRTRTIAFRVANLAVNSRETKSIGPFTGPAVLQRIQWWCDNANASAVHALGFGTSNIPITENTVAINAQKGWEELIERIDRDGYATDAATIGFWQPNTSPPLVGFRGDVRILINKPTFYITITAYGSAGAGNRWTGDLTVIEGLSDEALRSFL